jgi:predicted RNA binding protein YcfA (HicA-like mRNA interferase family)
MAFEYGSLRGTTARELISALVRDGFAFDRGSGSHQIYRHSDGRRVTVTFHGSGDTFAPKTLKSMIETEAKWTVEDLNFGKDLGRRASCQAAFRMSTIRRLFSAENAASSCSILDVWPMSMSLSTCCL